MPSLTHLLREDLRSDFLRHGFTPSEADRLAARLRDVARALRERGTPLATPAFAGFVPGRIEVLGKHTDYAGGSSLVGALPRGFVFVAVPAPRNRFDVLDAATGAHVSLPLRADIGAAPGHWSLYPALVVRRLLSNFGPDLIGGTFAFHSDLPPASGLSSSSAFVTAVFLALSALNDLPAHPRFRAAGLEAPVRLAAYLGAVEAGRAFEGLAGEAGAGTSGGCQDHAAILCGAPGRLRRFAYGPLRHVSDHALPEGYLLAVASSGVLAEKAGGARNRYNRATRLAEAFVRAWNATHGHSHPHLGALIRHSALTPEQLDRELTLAGTPFSATDLRRRFEHFYLEHEVLLPEAVAALDRGDVDAFGERVRRSHEAAAALLGNQVPETMYLARAAASLGAVAASAFGAGFGGAVWALVPAPAATTFLKAWRAAYTRQFPARSSAAHFFLTRPGPPAVLLP